MLNSTYISYKLQHFPQCSIYCRSTITLTRGAIRSLIPNTLVGINVFCNLLREFLQPHQSVFSKSTTSPTPDCTTGLDEVQPPLKPWLKHGYPQLQGNSKNNNALLPQPARLFATCIALTLGQLDGLSAFPPSKNADTDYQSHSPPTTPNTHIPLDPHWTRGAAMIAQSDSLYADRVSDPAGAHRILEV